jgi:hypothetical protein
MQPPDSFKGAVPLKELLPSSESIEVASPDDENDTAVKKFQEECDKQKKVVAENFEKFITISRPFVAFIIGAIIGAKTMQVGRFWCYAIPVSINLYIIIELQLKVYATYSSTNATCTTKAAVPDAAK